jgi:hypothetical protein
MAELLSKINNFSSRYPLRSEKKESSSLDYSTKDQSRQQSSSLHSRNVRLDQSNYASLKVSSLSKATATRSLQQADSLSSPINRLNLITEREYTIPMPR